MPTTDAAPPDSPELQLKEARELVSTLFDMMSISRVVIVDDAYSASAAVEDVLGKCMSLILGGKVDSLRQIEPFKALELPAEDAEACRSQIKKALESMDESTRKKVAVGVADESIGQTDGEELTRTHFRELLDKYEMEELSLQDWNARKTELLGSGSTSRTLFLFDQDMTGNAGGHATQGIEIIAELLRDTTISSIYCGLVSHTVLKDHEFEEWNRLAAQHHLSAEKGRFAVLSKAHLRDDPRAFAFRLKRVAITEHCDRLKQLVCNALREAHASASERLNELNIYDFEQIVFQSSYREGVWEPDTLIRVFNLFHREETRKSARLNTELRRIADTVRSVVKLPFRPKDAPELTSRLIRHSELYEDPQFLNEHHLPIELGDLFLIGEGSSKKKVVLIAQPCDLMVRSDGKRGSMYEAVIAEIVAKPPDASFELPLFKADQTQSMWVRFIKTKTVIIDAFDLTVFRSDGSSQMRVAEEAPSGLTPSWAKRCEILKGVYKNALDQYATASNGADANALTLIRRQLLRMSDDIASSEIDCQNQQIRYKIKRIGRIKEPLVGSMLRRYAAHVSRDWFEYNLTGEVSPKEQS